MKLETPVPANDPARLFELKKKTKRVEASVRRYHLGAILAPATRDKVKPYMDIRYRHPGNIPASKKPTSKVRWYEAQKARTYPERGELLAILHSSVSSPP